MATRSDSPPTPRIRWSDGVPSGRWSKGSSTNSGFVVGRDDVGYGVWRFEDIDTGEPLERFSDDDEAYEAAPQERWRQLSRADRRVRRPPIEWVKRGFIASATLWIVGRFLILNAVFLVDVLFGPIRTFPESRFERLVDVVGLVGVRLMLALGGIYVVMWLDSRRQ